jgi:DinB superfamily
MVETSASVLPAVLRCEGDTMTENHAPVANLNASTFVGQPTHAIARRITQTHELIVKVTWALSDPQLAQRPAHVAASVCPSIAWHLWHIARWADLLQASLPGMAATSERPRGPGRQVWEVEDLAARWGLVPSRGYRDTGMGLDDDESARLRLPDKELLLDYSRRVFARTDRAVMEVNEELFVRRCTDLYNRQTSIGTAVMSHLTHANRHLGMMEALRGVLGVPGTATL